MPEDHGDQVTGRESTGGASLDGGCSHRWHPPYAADDVTIDAAEAVRLLGPARDVLDRVATGRAYPSEAADMAQRIVDVIGHGTTDEPPHAAVRAAAAEADADRLAHALRVVLNGPTCSALRLHDEAVKARG